MRNGERPGFLVRAVTVSPGATRAYDEDEWRDALVAVGRGEIELEGLSGTLYRFRRGHLLCLADLPPRALHNPGHEPLVLVAVSRR
jgi:hypothetical protein